MKKVLLFDSDVRDSYFVLAKIIVKFVSTKIFGCTKYFNPGAIVNPLVLILWFGDVNKPVGVGLKVVLSK